MKKSVSGKKSTVKTNIHHNEREFSEAEWSHPKNAHIRKPTGVPELDKNYENVILENTPIEKKMNEVFGADVEEYNMERTFKFEAKKAEGKKPKKKDYKTIDNVYKHFKENGNFKENYQVEFIFQVGTHDDFTTKNKLGESTGLSENEILENREKAKNILIDYYNEFQKNNSNFHSYSAVIHMDEQSPHLHLCVIPQARGYKKGVKSAPAFERAMSQMGYEGEKQELFHNFMEGQREKIENIMTDYGWEREKVGTKKFRNQEEFIENKELKNENNKLENELKTKQLDKSKLNLNIIDKNEEYSEISKNVENKKHEEKRLDLSLKTKESTLQEVPDLSNKKNLKIKKTQQKTIMGKEIDSYIVEGKTIREVEKMISASASISQKNNYLESKNEKLSFEKEKLNSSINELTKDRDDWKKAAETYSTNYRKVYNENKTLKTENSSLKKQLKTVYDNLKEKVKEHKFVEELFDRVPVLKKFKKQEENQKSLSNTIVSECNWHLSDKPKIYYKPETWETELSRQFKIKDIDELDYCITPEEFYDTHKKDIEETLDKYEKTHGKNLRGNLKDKESEIYKSQTSKFAYQIKILELKDKVKKGNFEIPEHHKHSKEDVEKMNQKSRIIQSRGGWDMGR